MTSSTLTVELGARRYPIVIGRGLLGRNACLAEWIAGDSALIVTNSVVAPVHLAHARAAVGADKRIVECVLPDGERYKNLDTLGRVFDAAIDGRCDRQTTVIALGGGVVGDTAGFAAATFQRGVPFIQIPTTLLAQVDSSVGGKTGVNHPRGKNMIGAFHQPVAVLADTATLDTLDDRQIRAGLAEVIKYGLIGDRPFFDWLEEHMPSLLARDPQALAWTVEQSCRNKAAVVAADEYEHGHRALLNLGHTFGHAIEAATGYGDWLHGEAIAAGMCMAARLSVRLGLLEPAERGRIEALFTAAGLPTRPPPIEPERMRGLMASDKKVRDDRVRLVLIESIGRARLTGDYPPEALMAELSAATTAATS